MTQKKPVPFGYIVTSYITVCGIKLRPDTMMICSSWETAEDFFHEVSSKIKFPFIRTEKSSVKIYSQTPIIDGIKELIMCVPSGIVKRTVCLETWLIL